MSDTFAAFPTLNGQVPTVVTALITATGATVLYVKQVLLYNEDTATELITVYVFSASTGAARPIRQVSLGYQQSYKVLEHGESITLTPGDSIQAVSSGGLVDYTVSGVQET